MSNSAINVSKRKKKQQKNHEKTKDSVTEISHQKTENSVTVKYQKTVMRSIMYLFQLMANEYFR